MILIFVAGKYGGMEIDRWMDGWMDGWMDRWMDGGWMVDGVSPPERYVK
jgi:hypothetical protein